MVTTFYLDKEWSVTEMHLFTSSISTLYNIALVLDDNSLRGHFKDYLKEVKNKNRVSDYNPIHCYEFYEDLQYFLEDSIGDTWHLVIKSISLSSPGKLIVLGLKECLDNIKKINELIDEKIENGDITPKDLEHKKLNESITTTKNKTSQISQDPELGNLNVDFGEDTTLVKDMIDNEIAIFAYLKTTGKITKVK